MMRSAFSVAMFGIVENVETSLLPSSLLQVECPYIAGKVVGIEDGEESGTVFGYQSGMPEMSGKMFVSDLSSKHVELVFEEGESERRSGRRSVVLIRYR